MLRRFRRHAPIAALLAALSGAALAEGCLVLEDGSDPWDHLDETVEVRSMTVMTVVRFDSTRRRGTIGAKRRKWTDDVPSDTIGVQAICDRVQFETAYPFDGPGDLPIVMLQGERLNLSVDLGNHPELKIRLEAHERLLTTKPGPAYLTAVDLEAPDWRPKLFERMATIGQVDEDRWMIALPGGLHIVPLKP
ncbi:MAG: hypothetical protein AAF557_17915 [Pseudomonadota bacterium]